MWQVKSFEQLSVFELFEIYKLRVAVFVVEQNCPYQEVDDLDLTAIHLFAKKAEKLTAYARIMPSENYTKIGRVIVSCDARGNGLARKLMQQAVEIAKRFAKPIGIQAQSSLISFYQSLGFQACSEIYLEDGIPHLDMVLAH
ncbi:GNAT family N-acetyltransferase [Actinobacillus vicugnae]|uniref:GNAT family N-acetyltransferase n=1 Tax=Actinobacillus vicugnae TaxID=2573093 RepID=UPI0012421EBF|nr:GNAT family N-acetyltransferase [Actinobacillus vicugnae]